MRIATVLKAVSIFWRASVQAELEYRVNFIMSALTASLGLLGGIFGVSLFYQRDQAFSGWTFDEALIVLGVFTLLTGFSAALLVPNLSKIVDHVESGTLDFILLKPIDSQLHVSVRAFSLWGIPDVALGVGLIVYGGWSAGITVPRVLLFGGALGCAALLLYGLWFLLASTSIWFIRVYNAAEVLRGLLEAGRFPIAAYPAGVRVFFTFVVPVAFMTTTPASILVGRASFEQVGWALVAALVAFGLSRTVWKVALRSYTSASS